MNIYYYYYLNKIYKRIAPNFHISKKAQQIVGPKLFWAPQAHIIHLHFSQTISHQGGSQFSVESYPKQSLPSNGNNQSIFDTHFSILSSLIILLFFPKYRHSLLLFTHQTFALFLLRVSQTYHYSSVSNPNRRFSFRKALGN